MSKHRGTASTVFGGRQVLTSQTSSGAGSEIDLPVADHALQVTLAATSTALNPTATVVIQGTLDPSSTAPNWQTIVSWGSTLGSGAIAYQTGRPVSRLRPVITAIATTSTAHTATVNAWYAARG